MIKIYTSICLLFVVAISAAQDKQGFFLQDLEEKSAPPVIDFVVVEPPAAPSTVTVSIDYSEVLSPVSKYLFGNNANIYMSQMVDQPVLLENIKTLSPNVLRFPGGNLSSVYFWNADVGNPPADAPLELVDANGTASAAGYWFGTNPDSWTMSVDNYYDMLVQTGSQGIITLNYGYARYSTADDPVAAAAHLAADWVRYDNGRTKFWEVGNESNGTWQAGHRINLADNKDGQPQVITGQLYGKHFKVFADSMRKAALEKGFTIYIGAQLLAEAPAAWWNNTDRTWNEGVFQEAENTPDYYIVHSYYTPYQTNSGATDILNSATLITEQMMEYVTGSMAAAGVSIKPLALTEWNIFAEGSKQQVSYINGMHAAITLGELIKNGYGLACRWDLANGWAGGNDHGMFSQGDEPGVPKWHPRAAYYYMYYFQKYFGDHLLKSTVSGSQNVVAYASKFSSGEAALVFVNKGTSEQTVGVSLSDFGYGEKFYIHSLTGGSDNGDFSLKVFVNGKGPPFSSGGPTNIEDVEPRAADMTEGIKFLSPGRSVQYVLIENGDRVITGTQREEMNAVNIYPNPGRNNFKISFPGTGFFKVEIRSASGIKVYEEKIDTSVTELDLLPALPPGLYTLGFYKDKKNFYRKIVIY
jgi:hypothetical protein